MCIRDRMKGLIACLRVISVSWVGDKTFSKQTSTCFKSHLLGCSAYFKNDFAGVIFLLFTFKKNRLFDGSFDVVGVVGIAIFLFSSEFEPHAPWFPSILNKEKHGDRKDRSWAGTLQKIGRSPGVGYPSSPKILNSRKIWNMFFKRN